MLCVNETDFREPARRAYRGMLTARAFDTKISALYKAGKIYGGVFLGRGHEAIAACEAVFLTKGHDVYTPFIREQAGRCVWGDSVLESARTYLGSAQGCMRGRDGNVHWGKPAEGTPAPVSHLGAMGSVVAGMLLGKRMQGITDAVGVLCIGDGTTSVGATHEAANFTAVYKLPVVTVVTNNHYAYSTPNEQEFAATLADRGRGYGMAVHTCDGTDFLETLHTMHRAVSAARRGEGPQWVVAETLRMCGHGEHDDASYIPAELKAAYADRDPLAVARRQLLECGWLTEEEDAAWEAESREEVQRSVAQAQKELTPDPAAETWNATAWTPNL